MFETDRPRGITRLLSATSSCEAANGLPLSRRRGRVTDVLTRGGRHWPRIWKTPPKERCVCVCGGGGGDKKGSGLRTPEEYKQFQIRSR